MNNKYFIIRVDVNHSEEWFDKVYFCTFEMAVKAAKEYAEYAYVEIFEGVIDPSGLIRRGEVISTFKSREKIKVKWRLFDYSSYGDSPDGFVDNLVYEPICPLCGRNLYEIKGVEACPKCSTLLDWSSV